MTPVQSAFLDYLSQNIDKRAIVVERSDIAPWETDWRGRYQGHSPAIIAPDSTCEMAKVVRAASEFGVSLVPQGGNTSMVGGATPLADGSAFILSLRRLNRVREVAAKANLLIAEAGVILANVHDIAAQEGKRFPLTLGSRGSATIGGLISTNAGGTQVLRWGTMRNLVAGVEAVLPDGSIYSGLAALKKDNRGYDLTQLLIGAEGTLGVITAATLKLVSAINERAVAWVGLSNPSDALTLLRRMEAATNTIESFEIISDDTLDLVWKHVPAARKPLGGTHPWHLLIEAVSSGDATEPPNEMLAGLLTSALDVGLIQDGVIAGSEAQAELFWRIRDSLSEAERLAGPAVQHDISVPVDTMPAFIVETTRITEARFPGTKASAFGHLGDGNVHFHVRAPSDVKSDAWYAEAAPAITRVVNDLVIEAGGSISAEHGIGQMKLDELLRLTPPARLGAMRAIRAALDPKGIMNPGKLVPAGPHAAQ